MFTQSNQRLDGTVISSLAVSPNGELRLGAFETLMTGGKAMRDRVSARCRLRLTDALGAPIRAPRRMSSLGQLRPDAESVLAEQTRGSRSTRLHSTKAGCRNVAF